jgi:hypothetical protein
VNELSDVLRGVLEGHAVNARRVADGLNPANVVLLRGCGCRIKARAGRGAGRAAPAGARLGWRVGARPGAGGNESGRWSWAPAKGTALSPAHRQALRPPP